jgi:transcriptional regulator with XRE-family HTH domain
MAAHYGCMKKTAQPHPKPKKPRHFIREWRKHRGYTQERLAEMVGVSDGAISQLERGDTSYTQPMLEALAEALMCEPADLIIRNPLDPEGIWSIWDKASTGQKRVAIEIIRGVMRTGTHD